MEGNNCVSDQSVGIVAFTTLLVGLLILIASKILADAVTDRQELSKYRKTYGELITKDEW